MNDSEMDDLRSDTRVAIDDENYTESTIWPPQR